MYLSPHIPLLAIPMLWLHMHIETNGDRYEIRLGFGVRGSVVLHVHGLAHGCTIPRYGTGLHVIKPRFNKFGAAQ